MQSGCMFYMRPVLLCLSVHTVTRTVFHQGTE